MSTIFQSIVTGYQLNPTATLFGAFRGVLQADPSGNHGAIEAALANVRDQLRDHGTEIRGLHQDPNAIRLLNTSAPLSQQDAVALVRSLDRQLRLGLTELFVEVLQTENKQDSDVAELARWVNEINRADPDNIDNVEGRGNRVRWDRILFHDMARVVPLSVVMEHPGLFLNPEVTVFQQGNDLIERKVEMILQDPANNLGDLERVVEGVGSASSFGALRTAFRNSPLEERGPAVAAITRFEEAYRAALRTPSAESWSAALEILAMVPEDFGLRTQLFERFVASHVTSEAYRTAVAGPVAAAAAAEARRLAAVLASIPDRAYQDHLDTSPRLSEFNRTYKNILVTLYGPRDSSREARRVRSSWERIYLNFPELSEWFNPQAFLDNRKLPTERDELIGRATRFIESNPYPKVAEDYYQRGLVDLRVIVETAFFHKPYQRGMDAQQAFAVDPEGDLQREQLFGEAAVQARGLLFDLARNVPTLRFSPAPENGAIDFGLEGLSGFATRLVETSEDVAAALVEIERVRAELRVRFDPASLSFEEEEIARQALRDAEQVLDLLRPAVERLVAEKATRDVREAEQRARLAAEAEAAAQAAIDRQRKIDQLADRIRGVQAAHRQAVGLKGRSDTVRSSVEALKGNLQADFGEKGLGTRVAAVRTYVDGFTGVEDASQSLLRSNLKALEDQKKTILETRRRLPAILAEVKPGDSFDGLIGAFAGDVGLAELLRQAEQGEYAEMIPGSVEAVLVALEGATAELTHLDAGLSALEGPTGEVGRLTSDLTTWRRQLTELEELKAQLESRPKRSYEAADVTVAQGEIQTKFRDDFAHLYGTAYQSDATLQDQIVAPWARLAANIPELLKTFNPRAYGEAENKQSQERLLEGARRLIEAQTHVVDGFKEQAHRDLEGIKAQQRPFLRPTETEVDAENGPILQGLFERRRVTYVATAFAELRKNRSDLYGNEAGKLSPDRLDEVVKNNLGQSSDMPDVLSHPDANDPNKVRALLRNSYAEYTRVEKRLFELKLDLEEAQRAAERVTRRRAAESGKTPMELKTEEASKTDEARVAEKADLKNAARVDDLTRDLSAEQQKTDLAAYKLGKQVSEMASLIEGRLNKVFFKPLKKVIHPDKARLQEVKLFLEIPQRVSVIENDLNERLPELLIAEQMGRAQVRKAAAPVSTIVCKGAEGSYVVSVQRPKSGQTVEVGRETFTQHSGLASVSRRHITLQHDGTAWQVADLNSANGTYLNGVRVATTPVTLPEESYLNMAELYFQTAFDTDGNLTLTQVAMDDVPVTSRRPSHRPVAAPPSPAGVPSAKPSAEAPRRDLYTFAFAPTPGTVSWLGSGKYCEAQVHGSDINPEHLGFAYENGHWAVQDLGTVSGSRRNGRPIGQGEGRHGEWIILDTNDILEVGGIYFKLTITGRGSLQVIEVSIDEAEKVLAARRAKAEPAAAAAAAPPPRGAAVQPPAPVVILRGNVDVDRVPVKAYPAMATLGSFAMATSQGIGYPFDVVEGGVKKQIEVNQDGVAWVFDRDGNLCLLDVDGMGGMGAPHVVEEATQIVLETFVRGHQGRDGQVQTAQRGFAQTADPRQGLKIAHDRVEVFNLKQPGDSKAAAVAVAAHILNPTVGQTKHHVRFYASGDPEGFLLGRNPDGSLRILHGIEKHEEKGNPTKGLGMSDAKFAVSDSRELELAEGDIVLVGSDCLTKVYGEDIAALLPLIQGCGSAEEIVRVITEDAHNRMRRGGRRDNFSVGIYLHLLGGAQAKKQARAATQGAAGKAAGQAQPKAAAPAPRPTATRPAPAPQARPQTAAAQPRAAGSEPARPRPVATPRGKTQAIDISGLGENPSVGPAGGGTGAGGVEGKPVQVGAMDSWLADILGITIAQDAVVRGGGIQAKVTVKDPRKIKLLGKAPVVILTQGRQQVPLGVGTGARFLNVGDTIQVTYDGNTSSFKIDFAATGGRAMLNLVPVPGTRPKR